MRRYNYEKQVEKWDVLEVTEESICRLWDSRNLYRKTWDSNCGRILWRRRCVQSEIYAVFRGIIYIRSDRERDRRGSAHREISGNTGERGKSRTDPCGKYLSFCLRRRNAVLFHRHNLLCVGSAVRWNEWNKISNLFVEKLHNSERSENDTDRKILEVRKSIRKVLRYDEVYIPRNSLCVGRARFQMLQSKGILPLKKRRHCFYVKNITESNGAFWIGRKKAFSLLLSSHIRYTRCSDIERWNTICW